MPKTKRAVINSASEISEHFESEDAEREWWANHDLSFELWESLTDTTSGLDEVAPLKTEGRPNRRV